MQVANITKPTSANARELPGSYLERLAKWIPAGKVIKPVVGGAFGLVLPPVFTDWLHNWGIPRGEPEPTGIAAHIEAQAKSPAEYYRTLQREGIQVQETSRETAATVFVDQYKALRLVLDRYHGQLPESLQSSWHKQFLDLFEAQFQLASPGIHPRQATEEQLKQFVRGLMKEDKYLVMALKIAESQQIALQLATYAEIEVTSAAEKAEYVPEQAIVNPESSETIADKRQALVDEQHNLISRLRFGGPNLIPTERRAGEVAQKEEEDLQKAGQKRMNIVYFVRFLEANYNLIGKVDMQANNNKQPQFLLDEVQQAYLGTIGPLSAQPNNTPLVMAAQNEVARRLQGFVAMRVNLYRALFGRQLTGEDDLNLLTTDVIKGKTINASSPVYTSSRLPAIIFGGQNIEVGTAQTLDFQLKAVMMGVKKEVEEELKTREVAGAAEAIRRRIEILTQEVAKPTGSEDEVRAAEAEVTRWRELMAKRKEYDYKTKELERLQAERTAINSYLNTEQDADTEQNAQNKKTYSTLLSDFHSQEKKCSQLQRQIDEKMARKKELEELRKLYLQVLASPVQEGQRSDSAMKIFASYIQALEGEIKTVIYGNQDENNQKGITQLSQELEAALKEKEKARALISDELLAKEARLKELSAQISRLSQEQTSLEQLLRIPNNNNDIYSLSDISSALAQAEANLAALKAPDPLKERQFKAYQALAALMTPEAYNRIRAEAGQPSDNPLVEAQIMEAKARYPSYPLAYLRTLHILWGEVVTADSEQGRQLFDYAVHLLPPERFIEYMREGANAGSKIQAIRGAYDVWSIEAASDEMLARLDGEFIGGLFDTLLLEAQQGTIGQISPVDQHRLERMRQTILIYPEKQELLKYKTRIADGAKKIVFELLGKEASVLTSENKGELYNIWLTTAARDVVQNNINGYLTKKQLHINADSVIKTFETASFYSQTAAELIQIYYLLHRDEVALLEAAALGRLLAISTSPDLYKFISDQLHIGKRVEEIIAQIPGATFTQSIDAKQIQAIEVIGSTFNEKKLILEQQSNQTVMQVVDDYLTATETISIMDTNNQTVQFEYTIPQTQDFIQALFEEESYKRFLESFDLSIPHYDDIDDLALRVFEVYRMRYPAVSEDIYPQCKKIAFWIHGRRSKQQAN